MRNAVGVLRVGEAAWNSDGSDGSDGSDVNLVESWGVDPPASEALRRTGRLRKGSDLADLSEGAAPGAGQFFRPPANSSQLIFVVVIVAMHFPGHGFEAAE